MKRQAEFPSHPAAMAAVRAWVRALLHDAGATTDQVNLMVLAIDEACTNIIRHAYGNAPGQPIRIEATADGDEVSFRLRDFGRPAPATAFEPRALDPQTPGGFGLHFIRAAFDRVEPSPRDRGNELLLVKRLR